MNVEPGFNVLIVDDLAKNIQVVANILQQENYQMAFALDGGSALENARSKHYDLILLDVMMPEMDGFEVCRQLKAHPATRDVPVIFLTAKTDNESMLKGFELGAVDYVTKPFNAAELLARVRTHLRLRASEQQLRELNANKDRFLSIISHDLRTPFGVLLNLSRTLIQQFEVYSSEELIDYLKMLNNSAEQFYKMLENLLTWSRIQRGVISFSPKPLDLGVIAFEVCFMLKAQAEKKQIRLLNNVPREALVHADEEMTKTVLRNLTSNALKFTPREGEVRLEIEQTDGFITLLVIDTGVGIPEHSMEKLFRIEDHCKTLGTEGEEGTGLGLILCRELVEKQGGGIQAENRQDHGAVFRVSLPRVEAE